MSTQFPFWLHNSNSICDSEQSAPGDDFPGPTQAQSRLQQAAFEVRRGG